MSNEQEKNNFNMLSRDLIMTKNKLIGFAFSEDLNQINFVSNQLDYAKEIVADLDIEVRYENDPLLMRFSKTPDRFPCFMILKNDSCKNYVHAKMSLEYFREWILSKVG